MSKADQPTPAAAPLCRAVVWKKDTMRRTGRGKYGFEMHYIKAHCTRLSRCADGVCLQHARMPNVQVWEALV
ncbi:MAG: hypothetical protein JWM33_398 [Caulobacteraceae bacterium]|nr:hypothetical protein [Caulobacteraceae bacterium]